eukprot:5710233-Ditylum_brightwellii.AAC.1
MELPSSLKEIRDGAFQSYGELASIVAPEGVELVGDFAFHDCSTLARVELPATIAQIQQHSFSDCEELTAIVVPKRVKVVGESAFCNCTNL